MSVTQVARLEDFGNRSILLHGIMVITFGSGVVIGFVASGDLAIVGFVGLLGVTAGLWISHSVHSLGEAAGDSEYSGILNELFETSEQSNSFDSGRFGRLLGLIAAVSAVSLLTSAQLLAGTLLSIVGIAVGTVALVSALVGFLIALGASYDEAQP
ncbi:MAG: hypothetical protein U5K37_09810 [Natrialbaceae archaeon]|nr:hypothetical protein [Natrialbaceae archaeon]